MGVPIPVRHVSDVQPVDEAMRMALALREGMADVAPLLDGRCDQCGRTRLLGWTRDELYLCIECAIDVCIECGAEGGWHDAECSSITAIVLAIVESQQ